MSEKEVNNGIKFKYRMDQHVWFMRKDQIHLGQIKGLEFNDKLQLPVWVVSWGNHDSNRKGIDEKYLFNSAQTLCENLIENQRGCGES